MLVITSVRIAISTWFLSKQNTKMPQICYQTWPNSIEINRPYCTEIIWPFYARRPKMFYLKFGNLIQIDFYCVRCLDVRKSKTYECKFVIHTHTHHTHCEDGWFQFNWLFWSVKIRIGVLRIYFISTWFFVHFSLINPIYWREKQHIILKKAERIQDFHKNHLQR